MSTTQNAEASAGLVMRAASDCAWDVVALGEVMLRFDPGETRIARARDFRVWEGGGEYNVARGLRRCFSQRASIVTALVDNPVGRLVEDLILNGGVDASHILWRAFDGIGREQRNGMYFLERGFGVRAGMGMMDRGHTAIAALTPADIDWDALFANEGTRWFHTGGIMAALSVAATETVRSAMQAAKRHGVVVSFDANYRPSLWQSRGGRQGAAEVNRSLMPFVDVLFGHEGDLAASLGEASHAAAWHDAASFTAMAQRVIAEFPNLKVMATSMRRAHAANRNAWGGFCFASGATHETRSFDDLEILDRVGGGDAFAAGMIYGLMNARGPQWSIDCAVAHGALAMTTPGDSSMATLTDVERLMLGGHAGTLR